MNEQEKVMFVLREMAWERAKAELMSYLRTYYSSYRADGSRIDNGFDDAKTKIERFIDDFERNCT